MAIKFTKKDAIKSITTLTSPFELSGLIPNWRKPVLPNLAEELRKVGKSEV